MDLSIVATLYQSAAFVESFYERVSAAADKIQCRYEIVLVNDGSLDDSLALALAIHLKDPRVRVIDLSRNFGHHKAMMTGLAKAAGDRVFLTDCDLEEPPELLQTFWDTLEKTGADVVYGIQARRKGGWFERLSGNVFYWLINLVSDYPIPANVITSRLMRRPYVESLVQHRDREIFIGGLWAITGFRQIALPVVKGSKTGSSYNLRRKIAILVNSITSFSNLPLVYVFYLGCIILFTAAIAGAYLIVRRLFFGVLLAGWPSVIVSVWFFGGLTIFALGVIGIYLAKIFMEVKDRPYTIIRKTYEHRGEGQ